MTVVMLGSGYGGSCFPKDTTTIIHIAQGHTAHPVEMSRRPSRSMRHKRRAWLKDPGA